MVANYIAKWNGIRWNALGSGMNNIVRALAVDGSGNLYAAGDFTAAGGISANYIAKWNGSSWSALGSGMNNQVTVLAVDGSGNVYAGGQFGLAGGVSANRIAKWNGSSWSPLGSGMDSTVFALALDGNGNLYAGGQFTTAGGAGARRIAKWNGNSWSPLGLGMDWIVFALAADRNGNVYAGGQFGVAGVSVINWIAKWNGGTWTPLASGVGGYVQALVVDGSGNLYVGGGFESAGGKSSRNVVKAILPDEPPSIAVQPVSQINPVGSTLSFSVTATGSNPLRYQWRKDGVNLTDGGSLSGTTNSSLTKSNVALSDAGNYTVVITNAFGTVTSSVAGLTVGPPTYPYTVLKTFTGPDGANPNASLSLSGGVLYGTTYYGGSAGGGTVFKVNPDGTGFTLLKSFTGFDGRNPNGVTVSGSVLYGTTYNGGSVDAGKLFKMNTDGTGYTGLKDFLTNNERLDIVADGTRPRTSLTLSGNVLYGTTTVGSSWNRGTVFKVNTDGTAYTMLKIFTDNDGAYPLAGVTLSGSELFGTTSGGGSFGYGTVFKLNTNGDFTLLKSSTFSEAPNPQCDLAVSGGVLYGTTPAGGNLGNGGTVFRMNADGTGYTVLKIFAGSDGANPVAGVTLYNGMLYGATVNGGSWGFGVVFKMNTDGTGYTVLKDFDGSDGGSPSGSVMLDGGMLYGTTYQGGSSGYGTVFSINLREPPNITVQPVTQTNLAGSPMIFRVAATGSNPLSYQWRKDGVNLTDGGTLSGTASSSFTNSNVTPSAAGNYTVVVTNLYGAVTSSVAVVTVNHAPLANPDNLTRVYGTSLKIPVSTLLANDSDEDGDALILSAVGASTNGVTVTMNATTIFYANTNNVSDRFTYTLSDGRGGSATGTVSVMLASAFGSNSVVRVQAGVPGAGTNTLTFLGVPGYQYIAQYATNLTTSPWFDFSTNTVGAGRVWQAVDPKATNVQRYYRLRTP